MKTLSFLSSQFQIASVHQHSWPYPHRSAQGPCATHAIYYTRHRESAHLAYEQMHWLQDRMTRPITLETAKFDQIEIFLSLASDSHNVSDFFLWAGEATIFENRFIIDIHRYSFFAKQMVQRTKVRNNTDLCILLTSRPPFLQTANILFPLFFSGQSKKWAFSALLRDHLVTAPKSISRHTMHSLHFWYNSYPFRFFRRWTGSSSGVLPSLFGSISKHSTH